MGLLDYHGVLLEKKETQGKDDKTYLNYKIGFIGFILDVERTIKNFNEFNEGDLLKVGIFAKPSSVKTEFGTYNFSVPEIIGMEKAKDIKDILKVPTGRLFVLKSEVIKMNDSKDPSKEISYSKILLSGDINGEITGSKELGGQLEDLTEYTALMTLGIKKGQLQFLPTNFVKIEKPVK